MKRSGRAPRSRHFIEEARAQAGSVYGRDAPQQDFAAAWWKQPKWVVSRSLQSVGPNVHLIEDDLEGAIGRLKKERDITCFGGARDGALAAASETSAPIGPALRA